MKYNKVYLLEDKLTVQLTIQSLFLRWELELTSDENKVLYTHLHLEYMRPHPKWDGILKALGWRSSHNKNQKVNPEILTNTSHFIRTDQVVFIYLEIYA